MEAGSLPGVTGSVAETISGVLGRREVEVEG